jgi:hypothetical protein
MGEFPRHGKKYLQIVGFRCELVSSQILGYCSVDCGGLGREIDSLADSGDTAADAAVCVSSGCSTAAPSVTLSRPRRMAIATL